MSRAWVPAALTLWLAATGPAGCAEAPHWGFALDGNPSGQIEPLVRETGLKPGLIVFFRQWPENPAARDFPRGEVEAVAAAGAEAVITWEPMFYRGGVETMIPADEITGGKYDAYITAFAREAAAWGKPLIIRFAHEMNLSRYHWGGTPAEYGPKSPARYQAIWRHVVAKFRGAGTKNVRWAFCPNIESIPGVGNPSAAPWNTPKAYYPGDAWVDVLGLDGYNWGDTQTPEKNGWRSSWRSFAALFSAPHAELKSLAPGKPIYVFETACAPTGGNKAAWIADLAATAGMWNLAGVVWFEANKEVDWRLATGVAVEKLEPLRRKFGSK